LLIWNGGLTGEWGKLLIEELYNLFRSSDIIREMIEGE
jgi:hypothetical protein